MDLLAKRLTEILLKNSVIKEEDYAIYQFGFQTGLETCICQVVSIIFALYFRVLPEYFILMAVFIPIRSYVGGFHFEKFTYCFIGSCGLIVTILTISMKIILSRFTSVICIYLILISLFFMKPENHKNRNVDASEHKSFKRILNIALVGIGALTLIFYFKKKDHYLVIVLLTLIASLITIIVSKWNRAN